MTDNNDEYSLANWQKTYEMRLKEKGCESILDFLEKYQAVPYEKLGILLGVEKDDDIAGNIKFLHKKAAIKFNAQKAACKDALVRYLRQYNVNWTRKIKSIENRTSAYAIWGSFIESCCKELSFQEAGKLAKQIWDYLEDHVVPNYDWLPESPDDPLITAAFDKFWPEDIK